MGLKIFLDYNLLVNLPICYFFKAFIFYYFSKSSNSILGSTPHMRHVPSLGNIVCGVEDLYDGPFFMGVLSTRSL